MSGSRIDFGLAFAYVCVAVVFGAPVALVLSTAASPPPPVAVRVYYVMDAATFPPLAAGRALVFRSGLLQSPGIEYDVVAGAIRFRPGILAAGDQVEVATLP